MAGIREDVRQRLSDYLLASKRHNAEERLPVNPELLQLNYGGHAPFRTGREANIQNNLQPPTQAAGQNELSG